MANNIGLFFNTSKNMRLFAEVLAQVQEYLASKYSTLITDNPEEQRQQITAYIAKYLNDYSLGVEGMDHEALIDKLYTEMAEFSFLTPYLFASDVEEININSWKDTKITYADGRVVPSKERFQSPQHAVDVVRRLLHKSGMILDNSQPGVVGHLSELSTRSDWGGMILSAMGQPPPKCWTSWRRCCGSACPSASQAPLAAARPL